MSSSFAKNSCQNQLKNGRAVTAMRKYFFNFDNFMQSLNLIILKWRADYLFKKYKITSAKHQGKSVKQYTTSVYLNTESFNCEMLPAIFLASVMPISDHPRVSIGFCYLSSILLNTTEFLFVERSFFKRTQAEFKRHDCQQNVKKENKQNWNPWLSPNDRKREPTAAAQIMSEFVTCEELTSICHLAIKMFHLPWCGPSPIVSSEIWLILLFFFTPSTTDTHNTCAERGRARSGYHIFKKVQGVPSFLFRSWRATVDHSIGL